MTAANCRPWRRTSSGAAGVGNTPAISASPPAAVAPAAIADSSISPDSRVSRTIRTCGRWPRSRATAVRANASASSAVRECPARPRTPSVPKSWRATSSALRELRPLASLLEAGLLAFLDPWIACQESTALELTAQIRISDDQRAADAVTERPAWAAHRRRASGRRRPFATRSRPSRAAGESSAGASRAGRTPSSDLPLIEYVPVPGFRITRATAVLRLPVEV